MFAPISPFLQPSNFPWSERSTVFMPSKRNRKREKERKREREKERKREKERCANWSDGDVNHQNWRVWFNGSLHTFSIFEYLSNLVKIQSRQMSNGLKIKKYSCKFYSQTKYVNFRYRLSVKWLVNYKIISSFCKKSKNKNITKWYFNI